MQITSMRPRLIVSDPDESIAFYQAALGAVLEERYVDDGTVVHAALSIEGWTFSLAAEVPEWGLIAPTTLGGSAVLITLDVDDARALAERLVDNGAEVLVPIEDRPYGRCEGRVRDPFGHLWIPTHQIAAPIEDATSDRRPAPAVTRIVADLTVADTTASIDFFSRLLGLEVVMDHGWVAALCPPDEIDRQLLVMTADETASQNPHISVEVDDLDLVWQRARELGAEIVHERTVEAWGVERFFLRDLDGNVINVLSHADTTPTGT